MVQENAAAKQTTVNGTKTGVAPARPEIVKTQEASLSEQFTNQVVREFGRTAGDRPVLTPYRKRLAQHLFVKIDASLKDLEKKRLDKNPQGGTPIAWPNINMQKLAMDAMHRVELGLDALIPNHISPIPYFNTRLGKYDLDLRIGYVGKDYYRRCMALDPPEDIVYELVYENDTFKPIKKSLAHPIESYDFDITNPFDRGKVVGGFAYLIYKNEAKNKLIIVTDDDFKKSMNKAPSKDFWSAYPDEMKYKTIVNRATSKLQVDPEKVNESFMAVEEEELRDRQAVEAAIDVSANNGEILSIASLEADRAEETAMVEKQEDPGKEEEKAVEPVKEVKKGPGF